MDSNRSDSVFLPSILAAVATALAPLPCWLLWGAYWVLRVLLVVYDRREGGANGLSQSIPLEASDIQIDMLLNNLDASVFLVSGCGV